MSRAVLCLVVLLGYGLLSAAPAIGQPSCPQSTFPPRIGASPKNNRPALPAGVRYFYMATLRNAAGQPVVGWSPSWIRLNFSQCPSAPRFVFPDGPSNANGDIIWMTQLNFGGAHPCGVTVEIDQSMGGGSWSPCYLIQGFASNVNGGVRSPDIDGDMMIGLPDLIVFQSAYANQFPIYQGDMAAAFDDVISLYDLVWWAQHFMCP